METKQRTSLSELKVGIFVLVTCFVLALAIFAIGSQVGLFEEQFWAVTYLSNISGLKSGNVVLLGGVEVGNVDEVRITAPGEEMPDTEQNRAVAKRLDALRERLRSVQNDVGKTQDALDTAAEDYQQAVTSRGEQSSLAIELQERRASLSSLVEEKQGLVTDLRSDILREQERLQNIQVRMRINTQYRGWLRADSSISLGSIGLLGDKYIEISLGRSEEPPPVVSESVAGWFGTKTREVILITGTQQASFAELITGANDILANFETLSRQVQDIMRSFEAGEGAVGRFITDPSFYNNLNDTVERASLAADRLAELLGDIRSGSGTISKLVQEDELYGRITSSATKLSTILERIEQGEGTLGRFVEDPSVYNRTDEVLASVESISERIQSGQGTLGKLTTDDELYVSLRESAVELSTILKQVQEGKGTLGRLARDEELYTNLNQLSAELVKFIYDFRQNPKKFLTIKFELF